MYHSVMFRVYGSAVLAIAALIPVATAWAATAEDVYLESCAVCHGADGAGQTARGKKLKLKDLRSHEVQKMTDAQLTDIITKGKGKDMPPYEKELGKDGIAAQVAHIRSLAKNSRLRAAT